MQSSQDAVQDAALAGKLRQKVGTAEPELEEEVEEEPKKATHSSFIPEEVKITNTSDAMIKLKKRTAPLKVRGALRAL